MCRCTLAQAVRFGVVVAALLLPRTGLTQSIWVPTDLGTLGGAFSSAADINATAQVVGQSDTASGRHAFIWTAATGMVDLGTLGGQTSVAVATNNAGQVIGQSQTADLASHAFLWTASGGMVDLGHMTVSDINNVGQIVGTDDLGRAFLRMASGAMVDLGTLGGPWSHATAINDVGQVVGKSAIADDDDTGHAFMWTAEGGMVNLGSFGPTSYLAAINNAGQIVGSFVVNYPGDVVSYAFSWTAAGGLITLRCGTGSRASADTGSGAYDFVSSSAYDVNNAGQVVGYTAMCGGGPMHAFIWTAATGMMNLSAPFYPNSASAINDAGQIVGASGFAGVGSHAVLWQLVPLPPLSVTSLTPNVTFPVTAGTPVTWTASATDGLAPYSFQFWVFDGTTWTLGRDWSASASWTWEPPYPGSYTVQVWARNARSSAEYNAWRGASATISMPSVLTITSVFTRVPSVPAGTDVTWTATLAGGTGTGPYTYKFFQYDGTTWTVGQEWSTANSWIWTPSVPGTYLFQVWVRNLGSATEYDAWRQFGPYTATRPSPLTVTALKTDVAPIPAGTPVSWTATVAGGTPPYTYRFALNDGSWSIVQDWSESNSWTWLPTGAGYYYTLQVWVRNAGSTAPYDAWAYRVTTVTESTALQANLTSHPIAPVPAGTPVTWTARGVGGTGPYTYKFWVFDGTAWTVGRDWGTSSTWTWIPSIPGTYFVQAWIRNAGSSSAYDAWIGTPALTITSATPLPVVTLTTAPMSPLFIGAPSAVLNATAAGGTGPYTYQFWVHNGSEWTIGQAWSPSNVYAWRPQSYGTYWVQVWVRNAGSGASYDTWTRLGPLAVLP